MVLPRCGGALASGRQHPVQPANDDAHGRRSQGCGRGLRHGGLVAAHCGVYHQSTVAIPPRKRPGRQWPPTSIWEKRSRQRRGAGHCHRGCGYGENGVFLHGFPFAVRRPMDGGTPMAKGTQALRLVQRRFRKACKHLFGRRQCMQRLFSSCAGAAAPPRAVNLGPWFRWGKTGDLCRFAVHWSARPAQANPPWAGTWPSG